MKVKAAILALILATGAQAGDLPKTGANPPQPEYETAYDGRFDLRATLVVDRTGEAPMALDKAVQLRLDVAFKAGEGAKPADLALNCRIVLIGTDGKQSAPVRDGPCYEGALAPGRGWVEMGEPLKFRPSRYAAAGTGGVLVEVRAGKGRTRKLMATYGWAPEAP